MRRSRTAATLVAVLAGAGLAMTMLSACGGKPGGPAQTAAGAPDKASAQTDAAGGLTAHENKNVQIRKSEEDMIAACMKKSGFRYEPYVPESMQHPVQQEGSEYSAIKAFRSKYGFGQEFAPFVYPGDPRLKLPQDKNPNDAIVAGLDGNQKTAYQTALRGFVPDANHYKGVNEGCIGAAVKAIDPRARERGEKVFRPGASSNDSCDAACEALKTAAVQVKPLEASYLACLKGKGIPMNPDFQGMDTIGLAMKVSQARLDQLNTAPPGKPYTIDPAVARTELQNEIKVALDDLECGKDYIPAVYHAQEKAYELQPPSGGLW